MEGRDEEVNIYCRIGYAAFCLSICAELNKKKYNLKIPSKLYRNVSRLPRRSVKRRRKS